MTALRKEKVSTNEHHRLVLSFLIMALTNECKCRSWIGHAQLKSGGSAAWGAYLVHTLPIFRGLTDQCRQASLLL